MRQGQDSGGIKGCNETYHQQQQQQYFSVTTQKRRRTRATPPAVAIFFLVSLVFINHSTETLRINTNPTPESKASSSPSSSCYHYYYSFSCAASPRQILSNSLLPPNVCTLTPHIRETSGIQFQKQIQSDDDDVGEAHRFVFFYINRTTKAYKNRRRRNEKAEPCSFLYGIGFSYYFSPPMDVLLDS